MLRRAVLPFALLACACTPTTRADAQAPEHVFIPAAPEVEVSAPRAEGRKAPIGPRAPAEPTEAGELTISLEQGTNIRLAPTPRTAFDCQAVAAALARLQLDECAFPGDLAGHGHMMMVFDQSGRVASATLERGAFRGTKTGECIERIHETVVVPPFAGPRVLVGSTIWIREYGSATPR